MTNPNSMEETYVCSLEQDNNRLVPVKTVTVPLSEYQELLAAQRKLNALEGSGVDNWEGYDEAMGNMEQ
jgi:hypothetical protein